MKSFVNSRKKTLTLSIRIAISFILILGVSEIYFKYINVYPVSGFVFDEKLIWRMKRSLEVENEFEGTEFVLRTNSHGFRGKEFRKEKNTQFQRLMVLGDSYTAGLRVPEDKIFSSLMQKKMEDYEIMNVSCPAWGLDQYYLYLENEGLRYNPDTIMIMIAPNDIRESYCKKLLYLDEKGEIRENSVAFPLSCLLGWKLSNNSCFFQFLQKKILKTEYGSLFDVMNYYPYKFDSDLTDNADLPLFMEVPDNNVKNAEKLAESILNDIHQKCKNRNIELIIAIIPTKMEFDGTLDGRKYTSGRIRDFLSGFTEKNDVPFIDIYEIFNSSKDSMQFYLNTDFHFSENGHQIVADSLYEHF